MSSYMKYVQASVSISEIVSNSHRRTIVYTHTHTHTHIKAEIFLRQSLTMIEIDDKGRWNRAYTNGKLAYIKCLIEFIPKKKKNLISC